MPVKDIEFPIPIGLRISPTQDAKIRKWALQLGLQRNAVLRFLIDHVQLPDIGVVIEPGQRITGPAELQEDKGKQVCS
jgi:hypothetical protein